MSMQRISLLITSALLLCISAFGQPSDTGIPELARAARRVYLSKPDTALVLTQKVLDKSLETKNTFYEGYSYFLFSKGYWVKANYKLSTEYGFKALKVFRNTQHYEELSATLLGLARTLVELGNLEKAHDFIHEALQLGIKHDSKRIQADSYREHSYLLTEKNQLDSALYYSDLGIAMYQTLGDSLDVSVLFGRKSRILFQQQKYDESKEFAYKALWIDSAVQNRRGLGISYYQAAQNEHALRNNKKAIAQLKRSINISKELGNLNWLVKAHDLLSRVYVAESKPELAVLELQNVSMYKDELYNSEKNGQIQEMQSLHELDAKEDKIQLLQQENTLRHQEVKNQRLFLAFLLITVLFLVLLIFVLTRLRTIQKKTNRDLATQNVAIEQQRTAIQLQAENYQQLDRLKSKLFTVISHDLRGPISNLQALLDMFTQNLVTAEEFISLSGKLKENLNHTQRTLENLLDWSRSQMGGIKTQRKRIEIKKCIEDSCNLMREVAARKNITIYKQLTDSVQVWADADQIQVVIRNLIHNAIKFSSSNASILVKTECNDSHCRISVKDSGVGMTNEEIEMLLASGHYLSKDGTGREKGTGLGIILCKEFIYRNGGEIFITSVPGQGTEVAFTLPVTEQHETTLAVPD